MDSSSLETSGAGSGSGDALHGLKFGQKNYFEDAGGGGASVSSSEPQAAPARDATAAAPPPRCQVQGCNADLIGAKAYYCRHKVCGMHSKAPKVFVAGLERRFCQQSSRSP